MAVLWDRILLLAISILLMNVNQVDYLMICLILVVIIIESLILYFRSKKATLIGMLVFLAGCLFAPELVAFVPLMAYESAVYGLGYLLPVQIAFTAVIYTNPLKIGFLTRSMGSILVVLLIGYLWGSKVRRENTLSRRVHYLQDEESYLVQKNRASKEELLLRQDSEIHAATLAERNRIAREIHDHVGHILSRSILQLGAILAINKEEKLKAPLMDLKETLDTAMNNIRESVHDLKDDALQMEYMVDEIVKQYTDLHIDVDYDMSPYLSKELKYCFVAILKESLTNTVKHSDSTRVNIVMREHPALYQVLIEDNGSGSEDAIRKLEHEKAGGIGLENIRERVAAFGGTVRFSGEHGFKAFITIPKRN